jgi:ketosteroid isomerase-like protein
MTADADGTPGASPGELARAYLEALQRKDKNAILSIVSDDFVLEVPLNVSGSNDLTDSWRGIEAASAGYDMAFTEIKKLQLTDLDITPSSNPNVAFAEAWGDMEMSNGRPYKNRYIFRFDVDSGKIKRIREYCNPVTGAVAFGLPMNIS